LGTSRYPVRRLAFSSHLSATGEMLAVRYSVETMDGGISRGTWSDSPAASNLQSFDVIVEKREE